MAASSSSRRSLSAFSRSSVARAAASSISASRSSRTRMAPICLQMPRLTWPGQVQVMSRLSGFPHTRQRRNLGLRQAAIALGRSLSPCCPTGIWTDNEEGGWLGEADRFSLRRRGGSLGLFQSRPHRVKDFSQVTSWNDVSSDVTWQSIGCLVEGFL